MANIAFSKSNTALIIADFYTEAYKLPHAVERKCVENALALRAAARAAGMLVCYTATVFRPGFPEISLRNKNFSLLKLKAAADMSDAVLRIHPQLRPADGELVIGKHRVNALFETELAMILRAHNVDTLLLLGNATSGVILSTTRYAADADYRLLLVEDCCTDSDAATHDFLFTKIFPRQADIVQSADLVKALAA